MIPEDAIEVAARALARHRWPTALEVWDSFGQGMQDDYRDTARAALEAAAPSMRGAAWDEAHFDALGCDSSCCDFMHGAPKRDMNPHRADHE